MPKYKPPPLKQTQSEHDRSLPEQSLSEPDLLAAPANDHPLPVKLDCSRPRSQQPFEWQDWLVHLEDIDVTMEQKKELIETWWKIILVLIDLQWECERSLKDITPASSPSMETELPVDNSAEISELSIALRAAVIQSEYRNNLKIEYQSASQKEKAEEEST